VKIILDGWLVLTKEWDIVFGILFLLFLGAGSIFFLLKIVSKKDLATSEYFSISIAGVLLPLFLGISILILFGFWFESKIDLRFILLLICICSFMFWVTKNDQGRIQQGSIWSLVIPILILAVSVYIRLAFISKLIVPPYFDSAEHYSFITSLITRDQNSIHLTFNSFNGGYYHLGFHALMAALSLALHAEVKDVMLVFGQIILALIPLPLFFMIKQETNSDVAGIFAVLLAGWGWFMPAHAVNWGKYPALTSILAFEFILGLIYLLPHSLSKRHNWTAILLLILSIGAAAFVHTRSLVLTAIAFFSIFIALCWQRFPRFFRILFFLFIFAALVILVVIIRSKPILSLVFDPYLQDGWWLSLIVLLLLPFSFAEFPRTVFASILSIVLVLCGLLIPVDNLLPGYNHQTLLDRPFVEMVLFLPLSVLGGLGLAALTRALSKIGILRHLHPQLSTGLITFVLFSLLFIHTFTHYDFYPSECCQIFAQPDAVAFEWIDKNLSPDAYILIAASELAVLETHSSVSYAGSDAGIWLTPLINRRTLRFPYRTNFSLQNRHHQLCQQQITHIYLGWTEQSFTQAQLQDTPAWYTMLFSLPEAKVYALVCP
jgi:hypothetical protein